MTVWLSPAPCQSGAFYHCATQGAGPEKPPVRPLVMDAHPSLSTWRPGTAQYFIYNMVMTNFPRSLLMVSRPLVPVVYDEDLDEPSTGGCIACISPSSDVDDFGDIVAPGF